MADAIAEQIRRLTFYSSFATITNPQAAELSAVLARLSPGDLNHVFYSTSGSDANESANPHRPPLLQPARQAR